jgi:hypothetical protein
MSEVDNLSHNIQLVEGGQYLVEVKNNLWHNIQLVEDGQYLLEVEQPLT